MSVSPFRKKYLHSGKTLEAVYTNRRSVSELDPARILGLVNYGAPLESDIHHADIRTNLRISLPSLSEGNNIEAWISGDPVKTGQMSNLHYRHTDDLMFGTIEMNESDCSSISQCSRSAYTEIIESIQQLGYQHLLRMWNYFPDINKDTDGLERYRAFTVGRHQALSVIPDFERYLPSASAVGTQKNGFKIVFLAATKPGIQVENPRQISAFHYPDTYGPKSPSFARATLKHWPEGKHSQLFISGTASIVGHETLYPESTSKQTEEIINNINSLIENVRDSHQLNVNNIADMSFLKVYIRHPKDINDVKKVLKLHLKPSQPIMFLQGDICRRELLVEIEGVIDIQR